MKIFDRPIQFMPKTPKAGEKLCEKCAGIGWLMSDDETYVVQCRHCYGTGKEPGRVRTGHTNRQDAQGLYVD